jgi:hypothetical protein
MTPKNWHERWVLDPMTSCWWDLSDKQRQWHRDQHAARTIYSPPVAAEIEEREQLEDAYAGVHDDEQPRQPDTTPPMERARFNLLLRRLYRTWKGVQR